MPLFLRSRQQWPWPSPIYAGVWDGVWGSCWRAYLRYRCIAYVPFSLRRIFATNSIVSPKHVHHRRSPRKAYTYFITFFLMARIPRCPHPSLIEKDSSACFTCLDDQVFLSPLPSSCASAMLVITTLVCRCIRGAITVTLAILLHLCTMRNHEIILLLSSTSGDR